MNNCPECEGRAVSTCRCFRMDSTCKNGHQWHTCFVHRIKVKGHSDHSKGGCTCGLVSYKKDDKEQEQDNGYCI